MRNFGIIPEMRWILDLCTQHDCRDDFAANGRSNFFPKNCCNKIRVFDLRAPGLFKEENCKGLNKQAIRNDESLQKYRKVLQKETVVTTDRGFRVVKTSVATYELRKNGFSYFYPKRQVLSDGIHTKALGIYYF